VKEACIYNSASWANSISLFLPFSIHASNQGSIFNFVFLYPLMFPHFTSLVLGFYFNITHFQGKPHLECYCLSFCSSEFDYFWMCNLFFVLPQRCYKNRMRFFFCLMWGHPCILFFLKLRKPAPCL